MVTAKRRNCVSHVVIRAMYVLRVSPKLALNSALAFACPAVIRVTRKREVIVT